MTAANFERLRGEAATIGVELGARQLDQLARYLDLLLTWNRKINLTAITDPEQVLDKHFLDSLAAAPLVPPGRLIDVGAGAGFPGIPIAVVRADVFVSLLEATGKKASFLRAAVHALGLPCEVLEGRLEQYMGLPFDAAISRATFAPAEWLERAQPLVRPGGSIFIMAGRDDLPAGAGALREYTLPGGDLRKIGCFTCNDAARHDD